MNHLQLTIIVPTYNVDAFLGECLKSCLKNGLPEGTFEIIIVNDGSTDDSALIAKNYAQAHPCIRVVDRENGGLSAARNTGLSYAAGEYVWFVDSDDWIVDGAGKELVLLARQDDLDVLCFNREKVFPDGRRERGRFSSGSREQVSTGPEFVGKARVSPGACCSIFKRSHLEKHHLKFFEGILHEDQEFTPRVQYCAKNIAYVDFVAYCYRQREGSIMRSSRNRYRTESLLKVADSLFAFAENIVKEENCRCVFKRKVSFAFLQALVYYSGDFFPVRVFTDKPYYPLPVVKTAPFAERLKCRLCNFSIRFYLMIRRLQRMI